MVFTPNKPVELEEPTVVVDAGLPAGSYRFRLEVVGKTSRRKSEAVEVIVRVIGRLPVPPPIPIPVPVPPIIR